MNYNRLTKAQLIERVQELERQTLQYKFENFIIESQLLLEDLYKAIQYIYELGCKTRRAVHEVTLPVIKTEPVKEGLLLSPSCDGKSFDFNY